MIEEVPCAPSGECVSGKFNLIDRVRFGKVELMPLEEKLKRTTNRNKSRSYLFVPIFELNSLASISSYDDRIEPGVDRCWACTDA